MVLGRPVDFIYRSKNQQDIPLGIMKLSHSKAVSKCETILQLKVSCWEGEGGGGFLILRTSYAIVNLSHPHYTCTNTPTTYTHQPILATVKFPSVRKEGAAILKLSGKDLLDPCRGTGFRRYEYIQGGGTLQRESAPKVQASHGRWRATN